MLTSETHNVITIEEMAIRKTTRDYRNHFNGNVAKLRRLYNRKTKASQNYSRKQFMADCLAIGIPKATSGWHWLKCGGPRKASDVVEMDVEFCCAEFSIH